MTNREALLIGSFLLAFLATTPVPVTGCFAIGHSCLFPADCCNNNCYTNKCCGTYTETCATTADCCAFQNTICSNNQCLLANGVSGCSTGSQCISGTCQSGTCCDNHTGDTCAANAECCSGTCSGNKCCVGSGTLQPGATCFSNVACCSGLCIPQGVIGKCA